MARKYLTDTEAMLGPVLERDNQGWQEAHSAITMLLVGFPTAGLDENTGELRSATYLEAVGDLPAWAVVKACKLWNRKNAGEQDYRWAPSPPVLRGIAEGVLKPARVQAESLRNLLAAVDARPADYKPPEIARPAPGEPDTEAPAKQGHVAGHAARVMADLAARVKARGEG